MRGGQREQERGRVRTTRDQPAETRRRGVRRIVMNGIVVADYCANEATCAGVSVTSDEKRSPGRARAGGFFAGIIVRPDCAL